MIRCVFLALILSVVLHIEVVNATTPRIVSGQDAQRWRYPYIVSLRSTTTGKHACGGSLIAPDIVLTAAHCDNAERVWIGVYSQSEEFDTRHENIEIEQQIQHPLRRTISDQDHDVRILKLRNVSSFPLIRLNQLAYVPQPGRKLSVIGWGRLSINEQGSDILQQVNVTSRDFDVCSRLYIPSPDIMCASGYNASGTCRGDSGGPLILPGNSSAEDIQVGIVSFSISECVHPLYPDFYSRVSASYPWIRSTVCALSTSPPERFNCDEEGFVFSAVPSADSPTAAPSTSPAGPEYDNAPILLRLTLDFDPTDISWLIQTTGDNSEIMIEHAKGEYESGYRTYFEPIDVLRPDTEYEFVIFDEWIGGVNGLITIFLGSEPLDGTILASADLYDVGPFYRFALRFNTSATSMHFAPSLPPTKFPSALPSQPSISSSPTFESTWIMVRFRTYADSRTTGWRIVTSSNNLIHEELPGFFRGHEPVFLKSLQVNKGEDFKLIITDIEGFGFAGEAIVCLGNALDENTVLAYYQGSHGYFYDYEVPFTASANATLALFQSDNVPVSTPTVLWTPTSLWSPSIPWTPTTLPTAPPLPTLSPAPTGSLVTVVVTVLTDRFPNETGWEISKPNGNVILLVDFGTYTKARFLYKTPLELSYNEYYILRIRTAKSHGMTGEVAVYIGNTTEPQYLLASYSPPMPLFETSFTFQVKLYDFIAYPQNATAMSPSFLTATPTPVVSSSHVPTMSIQILTNSPVASSPTVTSAPSTAIQSTGSPEVTSPSYVPIKDPTSSAVTLTRAMPWVALLVTILV
ncbi:peptidase [Fragilaria crotonensis]|nr:peptidase [Fragilaria crotonensis]